MSLGGYNSILTELDLREFNSSDIASKSETQIVVHDPFDVSALANIKEKPSLVIEITKEVVLLDIPNLL